MKCIAIVPGPGSGGQQPELRYQNTAKCLPENGRVSDGIPFDPPPLLSAPAPPATQSMNRKQTRKKYTKLSMGHSQKLGLHIFKLFLYFL